MDLTTLVTDAGAAYAILPPHGGAPAPTLLLLASTAVDTLTTEPYCRVGRLLYTQGWNVVSLDLPCHGADRRVGEPAELEGWATRTAAGEDIVEAFCRLVNNVLAHLVAKGVAYPARIAAAGTSRGGFLALHAAAGNPQIRAVAAFAPVTDLIVLSEFAGQEHNPLMRSLALASMAEMLADCATWITIGNADARVDTGKAIAFSRALVEAGKKRGLACANTLRVLPVSGHTSFAEWHDQAAAWLHDRIPRKTEYATNILSH